MIHAQRPLSDAERLDWLRLARSENVGPRTFMRLIEHCGTAEAAIRAAPEMARRGGRKRPIRIAEAADVAPEVEALSRTGARLTALGEPDYPVLLAEIADPPPLISLRGDSTLLARRVVAVVGARNASAAGAGFARELATELGAAGLVVVSGLARGIDTAAHQGALATGTAAVLAGGIDVVYPAQNADLYERIVADGVVISEQPPGTQPTRRHFPPRNRLISGLALGVVVVEAAPRSGSLITARMALEQGREVFAAPGWPRDPRARGGNGLIRQGATLIESAGDVIEVLDGPFARIDSAVDFMPIDNDPAPVTDDDEIGKGLAIVAEKLSVTPVTVDELVRECQLSARVVSAALLELELAGRIERHPGNRISRAS
jgi:DNA processing protein